MDISGIPWTALFVINILGNLTCVQLEDQKSVDFPLRKGDKTSPATPRAPGGSPHVPSRGLWMLGAENPVLERWEWERREVLLPCRGVGDRGDPWGIPGNSGSIPGVRGVMGRGVQERMEKCCNIPDFPQIPLRGKDSIPGVLVRTEMGIPGG